MPEPEPHPLISVSCTSCDSQQLVRMPGIGEAFWRWHDGATCQNCGSLLTSAVVAAREAGVYDESDLS